MPDMENTNPWYRIKMPSSVADPVQTQRIKELAALRYETTAISKALRFSVVG